MDNAKSNDVAIKQMMSTFNARNMLVANGQYFHLRCVAHIINLVVDDGLKQIGMAVVRVREAVKWIKGSSARSKSFKDIAKVCKVDTKKFLCQDVPTRWNSTYLMLEAALPYEPAMKLFNSVTPQFELTQYFAEKQYKMNASDLGHFDILMWWKKNSVRFPILSEMAKDILAIPISSVASESAFSMGGRVLSTFRNSLAPEMVEALICSEDWLRSSSSSIDLMEEEGEPIPFLRKQYYDTMEALHKDGKVTWPLDDADTNTELERTYSSDPDQS
ncbi:hypothetical protein SASPL_145930 [Salvia splendens]|uniref:HAT C-terminal dimerisation domain-containing protein n=1 Tax=Salvia splendens TaxID=180675 RepID=A0A8X8WHV7_SALSN|nr:hypothetical protein SASPL_145930 [Salvia splendens]